MNLKIGDLVQFLNTDWVFTIIGLQGCSVKYPDHVECRLPGEMGTGLYHPDLLRKLTKLELALS